MGDPTRGEHVDVNRVDARRVQTRLERRREHVARSPRITADEDRALSSTSAAARPNASARSAVSSVLATPRIPSVPKRREDPPKSSEGTGGCLALGVLRRRRAFLNPYFLRSARLASRVRKPLRLSTGRNSGS